MTQYSVNASPQQRSMITLQVGSFKFSCGFSMRFMTEWFPVFPTILMYRPYASNRNSNQ